jgi:hypothetical protein
MESTTVEIYGVKFDVEGGYYEGSYGSMDEPPTSDEFNMTSVKLGGQEIMELLQEAIVREIENKACENIREGKGRF